MLRMQALRYGRLLWPLALSLLFVLPLFLLAARATFQDDRANDTTSAYYLSYGRNINRYPISTTKLLNIDLVGSEGKTILKDQPVSYYLDHPPLLTWAVALALKIKAVVAPSAPDLLAGRLVSILASIGTLVLTTYICQAAFGTAAAFVAALAIVSCPVYLSHGLVVNFEPLCCFLMLLGLASNNSFSLLPALLTDWPAFFAVPVFSLFEALRRKRGKAVAALCIAVCTGIVIFVGYGYLSGQPDFARRFITGTASFEARSYVQNNLADETKAIARLVISNFGILNCVIVMLACFKWLKTPRMLVHAQVIGLASIVVTLLNIVLFHSWAAGHSFWSYYLLPAVAIAYAEIIRQFDKVSAVALCCLCVSIFFSGEVYVKKLLVESPWASAETKSPILISHQQYSAFTDNPHVYWGHGYVTRWYLDRPLEVISSPRGSSVRDQCSDQTCIWLTEGERTEFPSDKFHVYGYGHFGNVYLTTFRIKSDDVRQDVRRIDALGSRSSTPSEL